MLLQGEGATRDALVSSLDSLRTRAKAADSVVVMLVGHGSYDGEAYKLNLPGPDVDGDEVAKLLAAVPARSQLVVNTTSASGAVLEKWAAEGRTLITATRSGFERNATRFAQHFAAALAAGSADINKNGAITAQEAFDYASRSVAESFEKDGALATEHPQIAGGAAGPLHGRAVGLGRPGCRAVGGESGRRAADRRARKARRRDRGAACPPRIDGERRLPRRAAEAARPARRRAGQDRRRAAEAAAVTTRVWLGRARGAVRRVGRARPDDRVLARSRRGARRLRRAALPRSARGSRRVLSRLAGAEHRCADQGRRRARDRRRTRSQRVLPGRAQGVSRGSGAAHALGRAVSRDPPEQRSDQAVPRGARDRRGLRACQDRPRQDRGRPLRREDPRVGRAGHQGNSRSGARSAPDVGARGARGRRHRDRRESARRGARARRGSRPLAARDLCAESGRRPAARHDRQLVDAACTGR